MTTTYEQATDAIYGHADNCIKTLVTEYLGYTPVTKWPFVTSVSVPDSERLWLRVSSQIIDESQSTLSVTSGEPGKKLFETFGILFIEIYCPKKIGNAASAVRRISHILRNNFRKIPSDNLGIIYKNAKINDGLLPEELYYRINVTVEFEYNETV